MPTGSYLATSLIDWEKVARANGHTCQAKPTQEFQSEKLCSFHRINYCLFCADFFLLLDIFDVPSSVAHFFDTVFSTSIFSWVFERLHDFLKNWGDLTTFLIGFLIGFLIPTISEINTVTIKDHAEQIRDYIRGNLLTFDDVYARICGLLKSTRNDLDSCFILVSQTPLLGTDIWSRHDRTYKYWRLLMDRVNANLACRFVCLSPFDPNGEMVIGSDTGDFYKYLEKYSPPISGATRVGEYMRTANDMFADTIFFFKCIFDKPSVDVIFRSEIPYQIFLIRRGDGSKKCVLLLNGKEAIKKNLPSGGFVSEDPSFIKLIEDSVKALVGADHDPYELRHSHTKKIIQQRIDYAQEVRKNVQSHDAKAAVKLEQVQPNYIETFEFSGVKITLWPYVFAQGGGISRGAGSYASGNPQAI